MRVSVINEDNLVVVNEEPCIFNFHLDATIHAIQWYGSHGEIEYVDPSKPNEAIKDFSPFQYLIDEFYEALEKEIAATEREGVWLEDKELVFLVRDEMYLETPEIEPLWTHIRRERGRRLSATDWTQFPDADLTEECVLAFAIYRQKLRDIPKEWEAPNEDLWRAARKHWPKKPEEVRRSAPTVHKKPSEVR